MESKQSTELVLNMGAEAAERDKALNEWLRIDRAELEPFGYSIEKGDKPNEIRIKVDPK